MARQKKQKVEGGGPGFLTTYADIVTLLMAFFVLLFAISSVDQSKFLSLLKGLEDDFGNTAYDDLIIEGDASVLGGNQPAGSAIPVPGGTLTAEPLQAVHELAVLASHVDATEEDPTPNGRDDEGHNVGKVLDYEQLLEVAKRLQDVAAQESLTGAIEFGFNQRGLVVVLSTDDVLFDSGSAILNAELSELILRPIGEELAAFDNSVYIEGHTDDVPLDRAGYNNWTLSVDRALAVLDFFELQAGIAPQRLVASGYGEYRPIADEASPVARQRNRRIELVIAFETAQVGTLEPIDNDDVPLGIGLDDVPASHDSDLQGIDDRL
jgi:chemotaxis protein MotB